MDLLSLLLAYWQIDEVAAGATIIDAHTGGHDIAESNGGSPSSDVAGKIGRARRLIRGGAANQYFPLADTGPGFPFRLFDLPNGFTLSCWVNRAIIYAATQHTLVGKRAPGANSWALDIDTATSTFRAVVVNTGPASFVASSTTTIPSGSGPFQMATMVYRKGTKTVEIWVDGVREDTAVLTGTENVTAADFSIGGDAISLFHDGAIDEVAVFTEPLNSSEIAALYNNGSGLPYPLTVPASGRKRNKKQMYTDTGQTTGPGILVLAPELAYNQQRLRILPKRVALQIDNTAGTQEQVFLDFNRNGHYFVDVPATSTARLDLRFPIAVLDPGTALGVDSTGGFSGTIDYTVSYMLDD